MKKAMFTVTGMSCSACSARVEKGISKLKGVTEVSVNLLKKSMSVSFDEEIISAAQIAERVEDLGFGVTLEDSGEKKNRM